MVRDQGHSGQQSRLWWMLKMKRPRVQSAECRVDAMGVPTIRVSRNKSVCLQSPGGKGRFYKKFSAYVFIEWV